VTGFAGESESAFDREKNMKRAYSVLCCAMLVFAGAAWGQDTEKKVKMTDLPAAVQKTVQEQSTGATLRGLSKEVEKGKTFYEAELTVNGHGKDILVDSAGAVVEVEEEVTLESLPAAARSAIQNAANKGKIVKLESIIHGTTLFGYEAQFVKPNGTGKLLRLEVRVKPDGTPLSE
jgi:UDP-N-acetylglucosamine enolpyruvyl transferase